MNSKENSVLIDEYGNRYYLGDELARGGQGAVYRTRDPDLAIKISLKNGEFLSEEKYTAEEIIKINRKFQRIRTLPLPSGIPISLPLAHLRSRAGYVMRLLNDMVPFTAFEINGERKKNLQKALENGKENPPEWFKKHLKGNEVILELYYYAKTGSTKRRLLALSKCAAILARLHSAGLVYCDVSPNNVFFSQTEPHDVWMIDPDNIRFERKSKSSIIYTPGYGAPELCLKKDTCRPRTDTWSLAVMAFKILAMVHPFKGKRVYEEEWSTGWDVDDEGGAEGSGSCREGGDPEKLANAGLLPFIDDREDRSNASENRGLPREIVLTPQLTELFQEMFVAGRREPFRRPAAHFWAVELMRAHDLSLVCPHCTMSYYAFREKKCPYCDGPRPRFVLARTRRWEIILPADREEFRLPHRIANPFSLELNDEIEFEGILQFNKKKAYPIRGSKPFPEDLKFEFFEAEK